MSEVIYDTLKGAVLVEDWGYMQEIFEMFRYLYSGCRVELSVDKNGDLVASAYVSSPAEGHHE